MVGNPYIRFLGAPSVCIRGLGADEAVLHFVGNYSGNLVLTSGRISQNLFQMFSDDLFLVTATAIGCYRNEHSAITYMEIALYSHTGRQVISAL